MPFRGGGGDGGASIDTGTYAALPAAGTDGNVYLPSDSFYAFRDSGSAWVPWGPIFPMPLVPTAGWSWVNQGAATSDTTYGGVYLEGINDAGWIGWVRTAPSTPYVITAWMQFNINVVDNVFYGLWWRQSSDGKCATWCRTNSNSSLASSKLTDPDTFSADYVRVQHVMTFPNLICFRIADNGTNRICSASLDGQHFIQFHSIGRTDFLTADQVGFCFRPIGATYNQGVNLFSWEES